MLTKELTDEEGRKINLHMTWDKDINSLRFSAINDIKPHPSSEGNRIILRGNQIKDLYKFLEDNLHKAEATWSALCRG